jgi:putative FmdB family regulatory protein
MPIYEYECVDCGYQDQRVAGIDDHTAICAECAGVMVRLDLDWCASYFMALDQEPRTVAETIH